MPTTSPWRSAPGVPAVREAAHLDAEARTEEARQLNTAETEPPNARALAKAVLWLGVGMAVFAGFAVLATSLRGSTPATIKTVGIPLITLGGIAIIVGSVPLMNLIQRVPSNSFSMKQKALC